MQDFQRKPHSSTPAGSAIVAVVLALAGGGPTSAAPPAPTGVWVWDDGRAAVEFHACGGALCGRITWLKQDWAANPRPVLDTKNPDPALRRRQICGIDYITDVKLNNHGEWKNGRIYDFNSGSTYDLDIDSLQPTLIKMRGYKGVRLLGANLTLVRPTADLPPCPNGGGAG